MLHRASIAKLFGHSHRNVCGSFDYVNANPGALGQSSIGYLYEGKCSNDFEEPKITLTLVGPYSILTKCPTRLGTICLETDLYYAASPEKTTGVDLLIHKPGVG